MNAPTSAAPALPVRLFSRGSEGSNVAKKKPDITQLLREAGLHRPILRPELFPAKPLTKYDRSHAKQAGNGPHLARAMADAPNPWTVLGSSDAISTLAALWQEAKAGDRDAARKLTYFVALLAPQRLRGRPPLSTITTVLRSTTAKNLETLTDAILTGTVPEIPTAEPDLSEIEDDPTYWRVRALLWTASLLCSGGKMPAKLLRDLYLPTPTGWRRTGTARRRAGRLLAAVTSTQAPTVAERDREQLRYFFERYQGKRVSRNDLRSIGTVARKRLSRARKAAPTGT